MAQTCLPAPIPSAGGLRQRLVTLLSKELGQVGFQPTDDLRIYITPPGWVDWDNQTIYGPIPQSQKAWPFFTRP